ncbi:isoleucine--tRNA ligase [Zavarzinia sp. CC-PAN008]|uniref:isoleucine--tRNA ligase n=1 Tax=Zavarzinia sp. CC-PAN008 TaxID=3243332 RepID=UPI003F746C31
MTNDTPARDYKSTLSLPETAFPMKAGLPKLEPALLQRWAEADLEGQRRATSAGRPRFTFHDGPPYANGNIHIGTALNKILKDLVCRTQFMLGKQAVYVPGWDCHGLPIEWKIEEQFRKDGKDKAAVPIVEFRRLCREFAEHWLNVQRSEFKRLGVTGEWDNPYLTMAFESEARIVEELLKFLMNGALYRGAKPVMWSVIEQTALAEAEVEYHDHTSNTIHVKFPVVEGPDAARGAAIVIWTTTPWTIPANRAIALAEDAEYVRLRVVAVGEGSLARAGEEVIVASDRLADVLRDARITEHAVVGHVAGRDLLGTRCAHPLRAEGYGHDIPVLAGDFVTMDTGTGFVHIAPGHGLDDFELGQRHGLGVTEMVGPDGVYVADTPLFAGKRVLKPDGKPGNADPAVIDALTQAHGLLARGKVVHSYPHSWRSKAPLIFRATPQWFISMETTGLRQTALKAIDATRFVPEQGRNRLRSMVENRPDWVISRQRAWGVPIALFVDRQTGEPLRDAAVNQRIVDAFREHGADAWFTLPPAHFLGPDHDASRFDKIDDIVDVWFESGCTHAFVLQDQKGQWADLDWPADLYLEGSDQHRGWFQSSLLEACGTRGQAPFKAIVTHGFVMDREKQKMSKSLGNVISPVTVSEQFGADILRLWVGSTDYRDDPAIDNEVLKGVSDLYRRIRNTLRYLLANLSGFTADERVAPAEMPALERWVLHRLATLDGQVRDAYANYEFHRAWEAIFAFANFDLSAFYFDVRKDALYCDAAGALRRRAARTVLDLVFNALTAWIAPILVFTAEEAWLARGEGEASVHLRTFPEIPAEWLDPALATQFRRVQDVRKVVLGALEIERREKRIGASLAAHPVVHVADAETRHALGGVPLEEIAIVSGLDLVDAPAPEGAFTLAEVPGVAVVARLAEGHKCARCWMVLPEVSESPSGELCFRCEDALAAQAPKAA